jgi:hypothetical protein
MSQGLLYGAAPFIETPELPPGVKMLWHGADGSLWDIGEPEGVYLLAGVRGLHLPPRTRWASPQGSGSRYLGGRDEEREVFWPLSVRKASGGQGFLDFDALWWESLSYDTPGTWEVVQPDGRRRLLDLRLTNGGEETAAQFPTLSGVRHYGVYLVATDPYWRSALPVSQPFMIGAASEDFIPPTGAPPFNIGQGTTTTTAEMANEGDVPAWVTWTVEAGTGGLTGVSVGVGDATIGLPNMTQGQVYVVDTVAETATLNGVRVRGVMSPHEFAPLPPRSTTPLSITGTGNGKVTVAFTPRYYRAWGRGR